MDDQVKTKTKKSTVIRTRLSDNDLSLIKDKLKSSGLKSLSEYIRTSALQQKITVKKSNADFELLQELRRSGNNLNQLAKRFHSTGQEPFELREALTTHNKVLQKVFNVL